MAPQPGTGKRTPGHKIYPYLLRKLPIVRPNQVWALDTTYIPMARGFVYLTAVVDVASRKVLAHRVAITLETIHAKEVIEQALARYGAPEIVNTDQGSQLRFKQYTSEHLQDLLRAQGITRSMSRAGEVWDNSAMESSFSSMKTERCNRKVYRTRSQAKSDVFDCIETFYNPKRRHLTLGYISPVQFEEALKA